MGVRKIFIFRVCREYYSRKRYLWAIMYEKRQRECKCQGQENARKRGKSDEKAVYQRNVSAPAAFHQVGGRDSFVMQANFDCMTSPEGLSDSLEQGRPNLKVCTLPGSIPVWRSVTSPYLILCYVTSTWLLDVWRRYCSKGEETGTVLTIKLVQRKVFSSDFHCRLLSCHWVCTTVPIFVNRYQCLGFWVTRRNSVFHDLRWARVFRNQQKNEKSRGAVDGLLVYLDQEFSRITVVFLLSE